MKLRILCETLLIVSQRFFGIPPFRFYALADGIRRILSQATGLAGLRFGSRQNNWKRTSERDISNELRQGTF
jgi:hypothetical protein